MLAHSMTNIETMKQALEALENLQGLCSEEGNFIEQLTIWAPDAMYALRTAIEQAEKQEPVAWISTGPARMIHWTSDKPVYDANWKPLYTTPPAAQRQWVGLTDEEAMQTWEGVIKYAPGEVRLKDFARLIRDKLKEKNT
jgi:hypothetical protein